MEMQGLNDRLLKDLERGQQQLDLFNAKKEELEDELAVSPVKQEAGMCYNFLSLVSYQCCSASAVYHLC